MKMKEFVRDDHEYGMGLGTTCAYTTSAHSIKKQELMKEAMKAEKENKKENTK